MEKSKTILKEKYRLCPSCSNFTGFDDETLFCVMCGEKLITECPACREPIIYPLAKFCPVCGKSLMKKKSRMKLNK